MFKTKPLIIGPILSILLFFFLSLLFILLNLQLGILSDSVYFVSGLIITFISVFFGGFVSAKIAGERAMLYGLMNALAVVLIFIVLALLVFKMEINVMILRLALIIVASALGSVCSLFKAKKSPYI